MKKTLFVKTSYVCVGVLCTFTCKCKLLSMCISGLSSEALWAPPHNTLPQLWIPQFFPHITLFCLYIFSLLSPLRQCLHKVYCSLYEQNFRARGQPVGASGVLGPFSLAYFAFSCVTEDRRAVLAKGKSWASFPLSLWMVCASTACWHIYLYLFTPVLFWPRCSNLEQHSIFVSVPDMGLLSLQGPRSGCDIPGWPCLSPQSDQGTSASLQRNWREPHGGACSKCAALPLARKNSTGISVFTQELGQIVSGVWWSAQSLQALHV